MRSSSTLEGGAPPGSVMWRDPRFHGLDLFRATFTHYAYSRHFHDTYVVAVGESSGYQFECERTQYTAPPGTIVLLNPGEVHDGRSVDGEPIHYRSMYPAPALMAELAAELGMEGRPVFRAPVVSDPGLASALREAHHALECAPHALSAQERLVDALATLLQRHAEGARATPEEAAEPGAVARARECLDASAHQNISLTTLAEAAGLTPFHFLRVFRRATGLPPHQYLITRRVQRAQAMIARGEKIAHVAAACGFVDQSHLNRCFKRILGVTPGRYRRNFIQESAPSL